jgi:hypothetical protein
MYAINVQRTPTQKPRNFRAHFERPRNPRPCHRIGGIANHLTLTDAAAVADDPCHDDPEVAAAEHGDRGHGHHHGDRREPVSAPLSCNPPVPPGSRKPAASGSKTSIESSSLLNPCVRNILLPEMPITLIAASRSPEKKVQSWRTMQATCASLSGLISMCLIRHPSTCKRLKKEPILATFGH